MKIYMLCEPEFSLPIDFDTSLMQLCLRNGINYGTAKNSLFYGTKLSNGNFIEKVILSENV